MSRVVHGFFQSPPSCCFPCPTASRPDLGTRKGQREGRRGRGRAPRPPEAAARTGTPAWRKCGPAPARGRRRRRAASVHRPRRRQSAFPPGGPQAWLKIGASVTPGPARVDLAFGRVVLGEGGGCPSAAPRVPRQSRGRAQSGPARPRRSLRARPLRRPGPSKSPAAATGCPRPTQWAASGPRGRAPPARRGPPACPRTPRPAPPPPALPAAGARPGAACSPSPCAARETGKTRRRRHYSPGRPLRGAAAAAAAVAQVPSRRSAGNGRLRGGAGRPRHVLASGPAAPGDRPLKGTAAGPPLPPRACPRAPVPAARGWPARDSGLSSRDRVPHLGRRWTLRGWRLSGIPCVQ